MLGTLLGAAERAIDRVVPAPIKLTAFVRGLSLARIPLLAYTRPEVLEMDGARCVVRLKLRRRTANHLGSMYIAALVAGADVAGGLIAWMAIRDSGARVALVFKSIQADFLRRASGDVHFTCEQGLAIRDLVRRAVQSGERQELPVDIVATVPAEDPDRPVARFVLTLSLKRR